jgi:microcystin-dependent protein
MEPFIAQIIMFGGNFAPRGWAFCDGTLMSIASNQALFSLLGTTYGGDGISTFALPELRSRFPVHSGNGFAPGLPSLNLGDKGGESGHTLTVGELPAHNHPLQDATLRVSSNAANTSNPDGASPALAAAYDDTNFFDPTTGTSIPPTRMYPGAVDNPATTLNAGGGQPHNNMPPYTAVNFIIALQGIFPSRS